MERADLHINNGGSQPRGQRLVVLKGKDGQKRFFETASGAVNKGFSRQLFVLREYVWPRR